MKNYFLKTKIFTILSIGFFVTSCNGQVKTDLLKNNGSEQKIIPNGQPKLIKNHFTDKYQEAADNVHCGLQDKAGNLWFGTTGDGVYRFDGKLFVNYTTKDGLNSNTVWSILEDKTGNIWIGTDAGVCRFDGKNINIIPINVGFISIADNKYNEYGSAKKSVWSMLQDKSGKLWFGTGEGVYYYSGKLFTRFLENDTVINKDKLHLKMVDYMLQDKHGIIWFASGMPPGMEGICRYDGKSITSFKPNGDGWIRYIIEDKEANLWFGGRAKGNFRYDGQLFTNFTEKIGIGNPILADKSGGIWFTGAEGNTNYESKDGIWRYDGKTFTNFSTKEGMSNYFVHCMIEDRNGNIWIGTRNTGLYKYDGKSFVNFSE